MANWVTLTADDVLSGMTEKEIQDFGKTSVTVSVPDRLIPILANLVAEIQEMIASRADNPTPPTESVIPAGFVARAVSIARWRMLTAIPAYTPGESRKLDYEKADAFFMKVAEGKIRPRAEAVEGDAPGVGNSGTWNSENKFLGRMNPVPRPGAGSAGRYSNEEGPADAS